MTEELKQKARESFEQYKVTDEDYVVSPYSDDMGEKMLMYNDEYYAEETYLRLYTEGYLAGATEVTKELQEENKELTLKVSRLKSDCDAYNYSQGTYQDEIKELKELYKEADENWWNAQQTIKELQEQIEKMKNCNNCGNYYTESCKGCEDYCHWKLEE